MSRIGQIRNTQKNVVEKRDEKGLLKLERPVDRWEDIITMDLREIVLERANWVHVTQDEVHG
jgi:hypothetical protein